MSRPYDLLLGRKTYEIFAAHWPHVKAEGDPISAGLNNAKKYVASRTLKTGSFSLETPAPAELARRKRLREE